MGEVPTVKNMVSSLIVSPTNGQTINENQAFDVKAATNNLITGFFSDPKTQYYTNPQTLGANGQIQGHSHITIQQLNGNTPPDPQLFAFFQGLNNASVNGILAVTVAKGLPAGNYRICTMTSSLSHQPLIMPVAQRGSQDDCIRINVKPNNNGKGANNGNNNNGKGANNANNGNANNGKGANNANNGNANNGKGANGQGANGQGANGKGANGQGANGQGANGKGANGQGANGQGANGKGANTQDAKGTGTNTQGANGKGATNTNNGQGANAQGKAARIKAVKKRALF
ncbi:11203_t:CDS:2 [Scutellospora calospora]|uniref:11203_t:CDS:1 n=1 Tax=Scutellospora calospora TaxID=85575 RepID=A0ACA9K5Y8_9GLOM|nr:11203_t:CDS:2 [Scutellospora calospora]